jgi:hypothetical protein
MKNINKAILIYVLCFCLVWVINGGIGCMISERSFWDATIYQLLIRLLTAAFLTNYIMGKIE